MAPARFWNSTRATRSSSTLANLLVQRREFAESTQPSNRLFDNLQLLDGAYQGSVADMVVRIQQLMAAALEK